MLRSRAAFLSFRAFFLKDAQIQFLLHKQWLCCKKLLILYSILFICF